MEILSSANPTPTTPSTTTTTSTYLPKSPSQISGPKPNLQFHQPTLQSESKHQPKYKPNQHQPASKRSTCAKSAFSNLSNLQQPIPT